VHIAPNGKKYYGITKQDVKQRWGRGSQYRTNQYFAKAIKKHGWDNMQHIVLHEGLDEEEAKELEQYMIQWYDTANKNYGYNLSLGGDGGTGCKMSEEQKQKLREINTGANNATARAVICITTNKTFGSIAEGARYYNIRYQSVLKCCKGQLKSAGKLPDGTKLIWNYLDDYNNGVNIKKPEPKIICVTTHKTFDSIADGARYYNIHASHIVNCCKGKLKSAGKLPDGTKLVWRYIDDNNNNYTHKCKKIICITTNKVFNALKDCAAYSNVALSSISSCCNGKLKSAGKLPDGTKLVWRYIDIIEL
jgi:hypothetical protein